jgi:hypothetical protein
MRQSSSTVIWPRISPKSLASQKFRQTEAERIRRPGRSVATASITSSPIMPPTRAATPQSRNHLQPGVGSLIVAALFQISDLVARFRDRLVAMPFQMQACG